MGRLSTARAQRNCRVRSVCSSCGNFTCIGCEGGCWTGAKPHPAQGYCVVFTLGARYFLKQPPERQRPWKIPAAAAPVPASSTPRARAGVASAGTASACRSANQPRRTEMHQMLANPVLPQRKTARQRQTEQRGPCVTAARAAGLPHRRFDHAGRQQWVALPVSQPMLGGWPRCGGPTRHVDGGKLAHKREHRGVGPV